MPLSDNAETDAKVAFALAMFGQSLRALTANVMRVAAGGGAASMVMRQVASIMDAVDEYRDVAGVFPTSYHVDAALASGLDRSRGGSAEEVATRHAELDLSVGVLRIVASRMIGQTTQVSAGEHAMIEGARDLVRALDQEKDMWSARAHSPKRHKAKRPLTRTDKPRASNGLT